MASRRALLSYVKLKPGITVLIRVHLWILIFCVYLFIKSGWKIVPMTISLFLFHHWLSKTLWCIFKDASTFDSTIGGLKIPQQTHWNICGKCHFDLVSSGLCWKHTVLPSQIGLPIQTIFKESTPTQIIEKCCFKGKVAETAKNKRPRSLVHFWVCRYWFF